MRNYWEFAENVASGEHQDNKLVDVRRWGLVEVDAGGWMQVGRRRRRWMEVDEAHVAPVRRSLSFKNKIK